MSPNKRRPYEPAPAPSTATFAEFQDLGRFFTELVESSHLKWWIILAGIGGLLEAAHVVWLAFMWVWGRLPR
jgi:hypothetical protein